MKKKLHDKKITLRNKGRPHKGNIVRKDIIVPGENAVTRSVGVADTLVGRFLYSELPYVTFNVALQVAEVYYAMNTMTSIRLGNAAIPFWEEVGKSYARYQVLSSHIRVRVQNRELVNSIVVCVYPTLLNSAISTATQYATVASLPGAKQYLLQSSSGGMSTHTFNLRMDLTRMIGAQSLQQDQWAGLATIGTGGCENADPTNFVYWGLAFYNPTGNNTLTSGGITVQTELRFRVLLTEPLRTLASDLKRDPRNPNCRLVKKNSLEEVRKLLLNNSI